MIAGTGGYVFGRVLRLGLLGALTVMAVFELSGPLIAWSGYPQSQVGAWAGWIFAGALLILRGEKRILSITLFAVSTAGAVYGGHPETLIATMSGALLFFVLLLVSRAVPARLQLPRGPVLKPVIDLGVAVALGVALSAPLLLPGAQLVDQSIRSSGGSAPALPLHDMLYLIFSNFDGTPVPGSFPFAGAFFYNETAAYVGVIAVVLALLGIFIGIRSRRPAAIALTLAGVVLAPWSGSLPCRLLPTSSRSSDWPIGYVRSCHSALAIAALAGIGIDGLLRKDADPARSAGPGWRVRTCGARSWQRSGHSVGRESTCRRTSRCWLNTSARRVSSGPSSRSSRDSSSAGFCGGGRVGAPRVCRYCSALRSCRCWPQAVS